MFSSPKVCRERMTRVTFITLISLCKSKKENTFYGERHILMGLVLCQTVALECLSTPLNHPVYSNYTVPLLCR